AVRPAGKRLPPGEKTGRAARPVSRATTVMELIPHDIQVDFVGKRLFFVLFSAAVNLLSLGLMLTWGFNYGVDFAGGAVVEVRFPQATAAEAIRQSVSAVGLEDLTIQDLGGDGRTFLLHFKQHGEGMGAVGSAVKAALTAAFGEAFEVLRVEAVGAKVSGDLRRRGGFSGGLGPTLL